MKQSLLYAVRLLILAFILNTYLADAQEQSTTPNPGRHQEATVSESPFARLLAQALAQRRPVLFGTITESTPTNVRGSAFGTAPAAAAANLQVLGSGTIGRLTKWTGSTGINSLIGDTTIFEGKTGLVGIGTDAPAAKLTVAGMIQTTLGGIKFPDGSVQTTALGANDVVHTLNGITGDVTIAGGANITITRAGNTLTVAAPNELTAVAHNATLTGNGTAASPLGVVSADASRQPVQASVICNLPNPTVVCGENVIYTVPGGKRLVIEYASLFAKLEEGQSASMSINIPSRAQQYLPISAPAHDGTFAGGPFTSVGQLVRLYAEAGDSVFVNAIRNNGFGTARYEFHITGYLVDVP